MRKICLMLSLCLGLCCTGADTVLNGNFADGAKHWQVIKKNGEVKDGAVSLTKEPDTKAYPWAVQMLELVPGEFYELAFEYRAENVGAGGEVRLEFPDLKTGIVTPFMNHNTIWNPKTISFQAQAKNTRLVLRVWPGIKPGSTIHYRNIVLRKPGELLPPPWERGKLGYRTENSTMNVIDNKIRWDIVSPGGELTVTTDNIWPESDHRFILIAKSLPAADIRWSLECLNLHGVRVGEPISGVLSQGAVDKVFKFPGETAFVRVRLTGTAKSTVMLENFSLLRLQEIQ